MIICVDNCGYSFQPSKKNIHDFTRLDFMFFLDMLFVQCVCLFCSFRINRSGIFRFGLV